MKTINLSKVDKMGARERYSSGMLSQLCLMTQSHGTKEKPLTEICHKSHVLQHNSNQLPGRSVSILNVYTVSKNFRDNHDNRKILYSISLFLLD